MVLKPVAAIFAAVISIAALCSAQAPVKYEPTIESLDQHPLPQWYAGAKLGIFIHWGLYSVPGWAPLTHPDHDFSSNDYIKYDPYAEWYLNTMRIPGSPTQDYHKQHYGEPGLLRIRTRLQSRIEKVESRQDGRRSSATPARATWSSPASTTKASRSGPAHAQSEPSPQAEPAARRARHRRRTDRPRFRSRE